MKKFLIISCIGWFFSISSMYKNEHVLFVGLQDKINELNKEPFESRSSMHYRTSALGYRIKRSIGGITAKYSDQGELESVSCPCADCVIHDFVQDEKGRQITLLDGVVFRFWKDTLTDRYVLIREEH